MNDVRRDRIASAGGVQDQGRQRGDGRPALLRIRPPVPSALLQRMFSTETAQQKRAVLDPVIVPLTLDSPGEHHLHVQHAELGTCIA